MTKADEDFFSRIKNSISLDNEQKEIILNDDDIAYVVAGAGGGKSTVLARKIQYLLEVKNYKPEEILVLSFTNKSIEDLAGKIKELTDAPIEVKTFHSEGLNIYTKETGVKYKSPKEYTLKKCIQKTFTDDIIKDKDLTESIILFFSYYMYIPFQNPDIDTYIDYLRQNKFSTLRQDIEPQQEKIKSRLRNKMTSIEGEQMSSKEEVDIANFLYLNGIDYEYESPYITSLPDTGRAYVPDFKITQNGHTIYIEHYGVTKDGNNTRFSETTLNKYKENIKKKGEIHKANNTDLIENYSKYKDGRDFISHLEEDLKKRKVVFKKRNNQEILEKLLQAKKSLYLEKLYKLIETFISNYYEMGYSREDLNKFLMETEPSKDERTNLFLKVCSKCIDSYENYLSTNNIIDFNHMIRNATEVLQQGSPLKYFRNIKYIIIDEYQDISKSRVDFVKAMVRYAKCKLLVVGDDWQSIYKFAGSDLHLFTDFEKNFPEATRLVISNTYRNSQELIDIAGNFVMANTEQNKKKLISSKSIEDPIKIYTYEHLINSDNDFQTNESIAIGNKLISIIEEIQQNYIETCPPILVLGRFWSDGENLKKSGLFEYKQKSKDNKKTAYLTPTKKSLENITIIFSTVHSAKGLGFENVILINCKDDVYGFPSQIIEDPVFKILSPKSESIEYAEERRLFYVSMTRTMNRFYIIAPYDEPSPFLLELTSKNADIKIIGKPLKSKSEKRKLHRCPYCGAPLLFMQNTELMMPLWICTMNCGFVTNILCKPPLRIRRCPCCRKGFLIVKQTSTKAIVAYDLNVEPENYDKIYLLGCTEYKNGCKYKETSVLPRGYEDWYL